MITKMILMLCWHAIGVVAITNGGEIGTLRQEIAGLQNDNAFLRSDVADLKALTETLVEKLREQSEHIKELHEENRRIKAAIDNLQKTVVMKSDRVATNDGQETETDNETDAFSSHLADANGSHADHTMPKTTVRTFKQKHAAETKRFVVGTADLERGVAFSATVTQSDLHNLGQGQVIHFDNVISNLGNAYESNTGIFRVPVSGWYVLSLTIMTPPYKTQEIDVFVNGAYVYHCFGSGDEYTSASRTIVSHANSGDNIWVQTAQWDHDDDLHGNDHTSFTAFLLYSD